MLLFRLSVHGGECLKRVEDDEDDWVSGRLRLQMMEDEDEETESQLTQQFVSALFILKTWRSVGDVCACMCIRIYLHECPERLIRKQL